MASRLKCPTVEKNGALEVELERIWVSAATFRRRVIWSTIRQSGPDSGLGFQVSQLKTFKFFPFLERVENVETKGALEVELEHI